ncbi:hypothetical protein [Parachlamydia acanthamoebae]|jgi:hypothetical protein|uniref:Endonuclease/exonuclease/phosphatase domain-containing protein n=2 Tax=Parachlamydia acanthamoebae TaxID=83552 RepID=F8KVT0_PARAV|nr:hypothetical protein [Parachlamydia acanthamoebae]EFB42164.1 hypothetical protein pah_c014o089 [Parachlamydia acanthamoebae str. Hall's coccus]KIA76332.1 hypothetical protein DB43_AL00150 [Parachlamydia acanthamoebae]CCB85216.1 putative uncharacterized protein [Parachlamydia acanthamoebae UV-7]
MISSSYRLNRPELENPSKLPDREVDQICICFWNIKNQFMDKRDAYPQYLWENRRFSVLEMIEKVDPVVCGLSEFNLPQAQDLEAHFPDWKLVGFSCHTQESIDVTKKRHAEDNSLRYDSFNAILYNPKHAELQSLECHELASGPRHKRILVIGKFLDTATKTHYAVLVSHFDHLSQESRKRSGEIELRFINQLIGQGYMPFSIGDKNWFVDAGGEDDSQSYGRNGKICDFRDETQLGHFGAAGTYPKHLDVPAKFAPPIVDGVIQGPTVDVGFRSRLGIQATYSFSLIAEFNPTTQKLLLPGEKSDVENKNFGSDHTLIGLVFTFDQ